MSVHSLILSLQSSKPVNRAHDGRSSNSDCLWAGLGAAWRRHEGLLGMALCIGSGGWLGGKPWVVMSCDCAFQIQMLFSVTFQFKSLLTAQKTLARGKSGRWIVGLWGSAFHDKLGSLAVWTLMWQRWLGGSGHQLSGRARCLSPVLAQGVGWGFEMGTL
jgi:hypothetical protein